jgi:hypothetical protein
LVAVQIDRPIELGEDFEIVTVLLAYDQLDPTGDHLANA